MATINKFITIHDIEIYEIVFTGLEPMFETPNYEIAFIITSIGVFHVCFVPATVTSLFIVLIGYIEAQISALTVEMTHIWTDAQKHIQSKRPIEGNHFYNCEERKHINDFIRIRLNDLINRHATVITLLKKLENTYRIVIAVEFFLLIFSAIIELIGGLENTYMEVPFAFMQVFMDCLIGQRLFESSLAYKEAIYFSNWENFDTKNRKTLTIILLCSQKPLSLSAGGITTLYYPSFLNIVRSVYSAYATLRQAVRRD